jgi:hypothetical protein
VIDGGVDERHRAALAGQEHVTRVERRAALHARAHDGRVRDEQRHGLALHVRAHERAVGVVVLEERDHRRGHGPDLLGRDVHELDLRRAHGHVLAGLGAADDLLLGDLAVLGDGRVRLRDELGLLLRGVQVDDLVGDLAVATTR